MSMISLYTEKLLKDGVDFDIVYMDKYGEKEDFPSKNIYAFTNVIDHNKPKWLKALQYMKFRKYAINIIEKNNYDFIIVWNDVAIFMFANYLAKKWKGRYCLNIRDYCRQDVIPFKWRFNRVIKNSAFATTSSLGYKVFLPEHHYIQVHSLNMPVLNTVTPRTGFRTEGEPIRIGFVGYVRFYDINKQLLLLFKNDHRFEMHFYGAHSEELRDFAQENKIDNAFFGGAFQVSETSKYLAKIDVINNLYGNNTPSLDYALSIKLYHGVWSRIPILVCPNTYMEDISSKYSIGFTMASYNESEKERFYKWYMDQNFEEFNKGCSTFITNVQKENQEFETAYNKYIL